MAALRGIFPVLVAVFSACGSTPLKIGVGRIVPVAYVDEQGKAVGFAVDVLNEAARREGLHVSWVPLVQSVEDDIESGKVDLLSAGMATEERKRRLYVSEPWWSEELSLLTREGGGPIKRLGLQRVYVEFAREYFDPATFITDPPGAAGAAATEANAVCSGHLDAALITHGELHDLFLNRPKACERVRLQSADTAITYGLSILSRKSDEPVARRLRKRIDDLALDGTLMRLAAAHPPIPTSGAIQLEQRVRDRLRMRLWIVGACLIGLFLIWFVYDRQRDLIRARRSEAELREAHRRLKAAHEHLQHFAYIASHDLQEPLRNIGLYSQLLVRKFRNGKPEVDDYVSVITNGVERMRSLIDDVRTYTGVLYNEVQFTAPTDLRVIVREAMENLNTAIRESNANITCGELPTVAVDGSQVRQVFQNLLHNAIKYRNPDRNPEISITAERSDGWRFAVKDNGIGFSMAYSKQIFEPFKRLHSSSDYPGTGIGLAICKSIVERHGGNIWAESEEHKGSTFFFTIPADAPKHRTDFEHDRAK